MRARELEDRQVFDDAVLDLLETVMVLVEHRLHLHEVRAVLGGLAPRQRHEPVEVVAHHGRLGRHEAHLGETVQFLYGPGGHLARHARLADRHLKIVDFSGELVLMPQFLADRLELLVEIELLLVLVHLRADLAFDLALDLHDLELGGEHLAQRIEPFTGAIEFEQPLLLRHFDQQVGRNGVGQRRGIPNVVRRHQHFVRDAPVQVHVVVEQLEHVAHARFNVGSLGLVIRRRAHAHGVEIARPLEAFDLGAAQALDQHAHGAVRQPEQLQHAHDGARGIQLVLRRIGDLAAALRRDEQHAIASDRALDRVDRRQPADQQGDRHVGIHDDIAQRQQRQPVVEFEGVVAALDLDQLALAMRCLLVCLVLVLRRLHGRGLRGRRLRGRGLRGRRLRGHGLRGRRLHGRGLRGARRRLGLPCGGAARLLHSGRFALGIARHSVLLRKK